jgi:hypothetical protein
VDETRFDGALGADVFGLAGLVVRVEVFGNASANSSSYGGSVKLALPF